MLWRNTEMTEDQPASPDERWSPGASSFTRVFTLLNGSWQSRTQAAYDILGYGAVAGTAISRVTPMPYPGIPPFSILPSEDASIAAVDIPNFTQKFWAVGILKTEPVGVSKGISPFSTSNANAADYDRVRITVAFSILPYQIFNDLTLMESGGIFLGLPDEGVALANFGWLSTRFISKQRGPFSRLIQLVTGYAFVYDTFNTNYKPIKEGVLKKEGGSTFQYTWHRVPYSAIGPGYNPERIGSALGTLNQFPFDGMDIGTLLLDSYSTREYQGSFGEWLSDVTFIMIYLPHPATGFESYGPLYLSADLEGNPVVKGTHMGWNFILQPRDVVTSPGVTQRELVYLPVAPGENSDHLLLDYSDFSTLFRP